jgi:Tol biopolymer transport system component
MNQDIHFLGWSGLDIRLGKLFSGGPQVTPIVLDWQPGDIRNCSYASMQGWIGITAEDRTHGQQVLAVYKPQTNTTQILLQTDYILRHSFNRAGTQICYTQPSKQTGGADLSLYELESGASRILAEAVVAHGSTPEWFPDNARIAYHSPHGQIEALDIVQNQREVVVEGSAPAVHPDGNRLAVQRDDQLFVFNLVNRTTEPLQIKRGWLEYSLANGLSWSPDGRYLSFGLVTGLTGKETAFYLLDNVNNKQRKIEVKYLHGLIMIERASVL